ncbi:MAG: squalene--hopene cyclase [Candidatus Binatia bacterium]|nr:squalene--hopene cyclase [Candidatus Binatia bacterium]
MAGAVVAGSPTGVEGLRARAGRAADWARQHLLGLQDAEGFWHFSMEANATMDAQYIFANRLLGRSVPDVERRLGDHILSTQREDGSWALYFGGPGHLSCSIEAYFALKLLGHEASEPALTRARHFIRANGGAAKAQVFTRIFLAFFDQFPWAGVPALPPELLLLPERFPLSIYRMSSWARSTVVPLLILLQHRPSYDVPPGQGVEELWVDPPMPADVQFPPDSKLFTVRNLFLAADKVLRLLDRLPVRFRRRGLERALHWILERQDSNGGWAGIQPAMVNSVLALRAMGCAEDHPSVVAGLKALDDFLAEREGHLLFQPCVSPTWDTALAVRALVDAGDAPNAEHVTRAMRWLDKCQIKRPGDWAVLRPDLPAAGWAFEFANDWYPDVDDSAVILMDMVLAGETESETFKQGLEWTLGMQSADGGYGAFDAENTLDLWNRIPFADMKAMIDPPTEDLTGRLCELMGMLHLQPHEPRLKAARAYLRRTQRSDGSWWGRWGVNYVYGTWSVIAGLRAVGAREDDDMIARGSAFLRGYQNDDGGFGESCATYEEPRQPAPGPSTPSQTAWAAMGLMAGDEKITPELNDAISYLCHAQSPDGSWPEPEFTGTGFPGHFYLRYDGYRNFFPLMALGRYQRLLDAAEG